MHSSSDICVRFLQRRSTLNPLLLKGHRNRDSGGGVLQVKCLFGAFASPFVPTKGETWEFKDSLQQEIRFPSSMRSSEEAEAGVGRIWLIYYYFVSSGLKQKNRLFAERLRPQVCCSAHRSPWGMEVRFKDQVVSGDRKTKHKSSYASVIWKELKRSR